METQTNTYVLKCKVGCVFKARGDTMDNLHFCFHIHDCILINDRNQFNEEEKQQKRILLIIAKYYKYLMVVKLCKY